MDGRCTTLKPMFICKEGIYLQYVYLRLLLKKTSLCQLGSCKPASLSISFWLEAHCFDVFFSSYWYLVSPADSNKNKVQKWQQYAMMVIYLGNILHVCNYEFESMYICRYIIYLFIYTYSLSIFYPVTIFWLTLLTMLFALATAPGSSWVRSARSCETAMGNCAYYDLFLYTYKFGSSKNIQKSLSQGKSCLNILKPFSIIFHHSSILERARVHKGINCGATFKCESSFTTNPVATHEYQHQFCIFCKIRLMEEILHQLIGRLSHYWQGFIYPRWCRISSINSMSSKWWKFSERSSC